MSDLRLGKQGKVNIDTLKGGIKKAQIKDNKEMKALFDSIDANKDGVLDADEVKQFKDEILGAAGNDKLSKREAGKYLKQNQIKHLDKKDLFEFIDLLSQSGENIKESTYKTDANGNKTVFITYNDDSIETIHPNQTREIATKGENGETITKTYKKDSTKPSSVQITNSDGSTETTMFDDNGNPIEKIVVQKDGNTVKTSYDENQKPIQQTTIGKGGNPVETITMDKEGQPEFKTVQNGTTLEEYSYDENNNPILNKKIENQGIPAKEKTTTFTYNEDGTVQANINEYNKKTILTIKNDQVISEVTTEGKKQTERTYNDNGHVEVITEDNTKSETSYNKDNNRLYQTKTVNGETYSVQYDGQGNTLVTVQNGESIQALAKKFGCSVEDIINANKEDGKVKGNKNNQYFLVGDEIKIPKELDADNKALQGRVSREEAIQGYEAYQAAQRAKEEAVTQEAVKEQHIKNENKPSTEELKTKQREANKIAKNLYNTCEKAKMRTVNSDEFQTQLKKVNSKNASMVLSQFNAESPNLTYVDMICSQQTSSYEARKGALMHMMNALANEARAKNVPEADITKYTKAFEISMNAEFDKVGFIDPKKMEACMKSLHGLVLAKDIDAIEMTDTEAIDSLKETAQGEYNTAKTQFDEAREEEKWAAKAGDTVFGWFGCITKEDMEGKLAEYKGDIDKLQNCKTEAEFKQVYEEVFGIPFDSKKIAAYETAKTELGLATSYKNNIDNLQQLYNDARGLDYDSYKAKVVDSLGNYKPEEIDEIVNTMAEDYMKKHPHSDKKDVLRHFVDQYKQQQMKLYDETTKGRSLEQMQSEVDTVRQSAFGTKDIVNDVIKYNQNQEMTGMVVEMAGEIAATAALQAIPGLGQMAAARLAVSAAKWGTRGAKFFKNAKAITNLATKTTASLENTAKKLDKVNKVINSTKATRIATNTGAAFVGTAGVDLSNGKSVKEALQKGLQNAAFAGAGGMANELAPVIAKTYGVSGKVAKEIAEEITEAALDVSSSAAISVAMIGDYTSDDAFMDLATGIIMNRLGKVGVKNAGQKPENKTTPYQPVDVEPQYSSAAEAGKRDVIADGVVARNADSKHLHGKSKQYYEEGLRDTPTPEEMAAYAKEHAYQEPTVEERASIDKNNAEAQEANAEAHRIGNNISSESAETLQKARANMSEVDGNKNGIFKNDKAEFTVKDGKIVEIKTADGRVITDELKIAKYEAKYGVDVAKLEPVKVDTPEVKAEPEVKSDVEITGDAAIREVDTPEIKPDIETKPTETPAVEVNEKVELESKAKSETTPDVEIKGDAEIRELSEKVSEKANKINDNDVPSQYKQLWADCKKQLQSLYDKLPTGEQALKQIATLGGQIRRIANSAIGSAKAKFNEILADLKTMFEKVKTSMKSANAQSDLKPESPAHGSKYKPDNVEDPLVKNSKVDDKMTSNPVKAEESKSSNKVSTETANQMLDKYDFKTMGYASCRNGNFGDFDVKVTWEAGEKFKVFYKDGKTYILERNEGNGWRQGDFRGFQLEGHVPEEICHKFNEQFDWDNFRSSDQATDLINKLIEEHRATKSQVPVKTDEADITEPPVIDEDSTPVSELQNSDNLEVEVVAINGISIKDRANIITNGLEKAKTPREIGKLQEQINALPESSEKQKLQADLDARVEVLKKAEPKKEMSPEMQSFLEAEKLHSENLAKLREKYSSYNAKYIEDRLNLIEISDYADQLLEIANNSNYYLENIEQFVKFANDSNIDNLVKLSKNPKLEIRVKEDGTFFQNDFIEILDYANANPQMKDKILDIASKSKRGAGDIPQIVDFTMKYPNNTDDIVALVSTNSNIKVGKNILGEVDVDMDDIMAAIRQNPNLKDDIMNYMSVQRKDKFDTSCSTNELPYYIQTLKEFPNLRAQINALAKDANLDGAEIHNLVKKYSNSPENLDMVVKLAAKGYIENDINRKMMSMLKNPDLQETYLNNTPDYTLIDKTSAGTPIETVQKRFAVRKKLEAEFDVELSNLKATLGDEFYQKVKWEEIIPTNATNDEIEAILNELNDSSKFFARTKVNERKYGKDIAWAHEMNMFSDVAAARISQGDNFRTVISNIASDYRSYDVAKTLDSNVGVSDRRKYSGEYRGYNSDNGATTPFNATGSYSEYNDRFSRMLQQAEAGNPRISPYPDVELTDFGVTNRGNCMIHPKSRTVEPGMEHIQDRFDELKPLFEKVKNGKDLTPDEIKMANDNIAESYFLMANIMPWARGSNGISDIYMRSMYKALGLNQPALKQGVSLDLEAFCMSLNDYKAQWDSFFEPQFAKVEVADTPTPVAPVKATNSNVKAETPAVQSSVKANAPEQKFDWDISSDPKNNHGFKRNINAKTDVGAVKSNEIIIEGNFTGYAHFAGPVVKDLDADIRNAVRDINEYSVYNAENNITAIGAKTYDNFKRPGVFNILIKGQVSEADAKGLIEHLRSKNLLPRKMNKFTDDREVKVLARKVQEETANYFNNLRTQKANNTVEIQNSKPVSSSNTSNPVLTPEHRIAMGHISNRIHTAKTPADLDKLEEMLDNIPDCIQKESLQAQINEKKKFLI